MTVLDVSKDLDALTMTITSAFDAPVERVWQVWADPRQLERWWGPPTHPATVVDHELTPGGMVTYFMTGPEGEKYHGWWRIVTVDAPTFLAFTDGFADGDGQIDDDFPTTENEVRLDGGSEGRTTMILLSRFPSLEAMEQILEMGAEEGLLLCLGQLEELLVQEPAG